MVHSLLAFGVREPAFEFVEREVPPLWLLLLFPCLPGRVPGLRLRCRPPGRRLNFVAFIDGLASGDMGIIVIHGPGKAETDLRVKQKVLGKFGCVSRVGLMAPRAFRSRPSGDPRDSFLPSVSPDQSLDFPPRRV